MFDRSVGHRPVSIRSLEPATEADHDPAPTEDVELSGEPLTTDGLDEAI